MIWLPVLAAVVAIALRALAAHATQENWPMYFPPFTEHDDLIKAALRVISATHYSRPEDPHGDAEHEYAGEQLALAARALVQAVDRKPADDQPIGWNKEN